MQYEAGCKILNAIEKSESSKGDKKTFNEKQKKEQIDQAYVHFSDACATNAGKHPSAINV